RGLGRLSARQEFCGHATAGVLKNREGFGSVVQVVCNQSKVLCVDGAHGVDQTDFAVCRSNVADHHVQDVGRSIVGLACLSVLSLARLQLSESVHMQGYQIEM